MKAPDHLATVRQLRALAGREQPLHQQLAGVAAMAARLGTATQSWRTFAPRLAALDEVSREADHLARALRELRRSLIAETGVPPDAA